METNQIKIGDKVAYNTSRNYRSSAIFMKFDVVKNINGFGHIILEGGRKFNKYGDEIKSDVTDYPCAILVSIDWAQKVIAYEKQQNEIRNIVHNLERVISQHRAGNGNYGFTDEVIEQIRKLTESIENMNK